MRIFGGRIIAVAVTMVAGLVLLAPLARAEDRPQKKLIEFGWDEPDEAFLRQYIAEMERNTTFDGCVFHVNYAKAGGGRASFMWETWSTRAFTDAELAPALADLKSTPFARMKHNFLRFNVTPGDVDWFDDKGFEAVLNNAKLAARVAKESGASDGVLFDIEQYNTPLFHYTKLKEAKPKPWEDYAAQVRKRGREVMEAFQAGYPDLTVLLTFGYSLPHAGLSGQDASKLPVVGYGLLAPLLDGMVDAARGKAKLVDGYELSYGYKEPAQFDKAYETMKTGVLPIVKADHDQYRRVMSFGFGVWLDNDWRNKGWDEKDPAKNYFTPQGFQKSVRKALERADEYVWIYAETPRWWNAEAGGKPIKLPQTYIDALRQAKAGK
jgi:hypothetical protein